MIKKHVYYYKDGGVNTSSTGLLRDSELSIVISTRFASEHLRKCIQALRNNSTYSHELVIVCDSASWQTYKVLDELGVKSYSVNYGNYFLASNFGAEVARRRFVGFLSDDMWVGPRWDEYLLAIPSDKTIRGLSEIIATHLFSDYKVLDAIRGSSIASDMSLTKEQLSTTAGKAIPLDLFNTWCAAHTNDTSLSSQFSPPWVMSREDFLTDPFRGHGPQGWGHDTNLANRFTELRGWKTLSTRRGFLWHVGTTQNTDNNAVPVRIDGFLTGLYVCSVCGATKEGPAETDQEYDKFTHSVDRWKCDPCKTSG